MGQEHIDTWEGVLSIPDLDALIAHAGTATAVGQRPGDFALGGVLADGTAAWPSGRCFNEDLEIRWWPAEDEERRNVLILNRLPKDWAAPESLKPHLERLAEEPQETRYLCVGRPAQRDSEGGYIWWEPRYGRTFLYLDSVSQVPGAKESPVHPGRRGRVYLRALTYELEDGRSQHRLLRFELAESEEDAS
jgi:hypothetical protein